MTEAGGRDLDQEPLTTPGLAPAQVSDEPAKRWQAWLTEAGVIMLSILAAFAVDAWWDGKKDHSRAQGEVASLRSEFEAIDHELARAAKELQTALEATQELARLAGPRPGPLTDAQFGLLFTRSLTINAVQLPTGALANLLASGDLPLLHDVELQSRLASWPSISDLMSVKFAHLVSGRDVSILPAVNQLLALSQVLAAGFPGLWVDDHHFPFDGAPLLGSREFENLMAERWIGIKIAEITVKDAQALCANIRTALTAWQ